MTGAEAPLTGEVRGYLTQRYGGATASRALWLWAGGDPLRAARDGDAAALWDQQWSWAEAGEEGAPELLALIREALYDTPGHPLLLDYLLENACATAPATVERVHLVQVALERLAPAGFPVAHVATALAALDAGTWGEAFAALAPLCDEWLPIPARERLVDACHQVAVRSAIVAKLRELRVLLRSEDGEAELKSAIAQLSALRDRADREMRGFQGLRRALQRLVTRLGFRKKPSLRSANAGLTSLLVTAKAVREGVDPIGAGATGLEAALYGTQPQYVAPPPVADEDDDEDDDENDPTVEVVYT